MQNWRVSLGVWDTEPFPSLSDQSQALMVKINLKITGEKLIDVNSLRNQQILRKAASS